MSDFIVLAVEAILCVAVIAYHVGYHNGRIAERRHLKGR
jgi:predicted metal-dependent hydrolase